MSIIVGPKFSRVQTDLETNVGHISSSGLNRGTEGWSPRVIKANWMQESLDLLICMGGPRHWITCQRASHCSTMQLCHCLVSPTCKPSFQYQWVPAADNTSLPFCQDFWRSARISNCSASALWESSSWKEVAQNSSHFIMKDCRWIETYLWYALHICLMSFIHTWLMNFNCAVLPSR